MAMDHSLRNKNLKKILLIDLGFWILCSCFLVFLVDMGKHMSYTEYVLLVVLLPLFFIGIITIVHVICFFRDKNKIFKFESDRFTYIIDGSQEIINKQDVLFYRYRMVTFLCESLTIFLNNGEKIQSSNLNDDFKSLLRLMNDWHIRTGAEADNL